MEGPQQNDFSVAPCAAPNIDAKNNLTFFQRLSVKYSYKYEAAYHGSRRFS